jgi:hypothetical protein
MYFGYARNRGVLDTLSPLPKAPLLRFLVCLPRLDEDRLIELRKGPPGRRLPSDLPCNPSDLVIASISSHHLNVGR